MARLKKIAVILWLPRDWEEIGRRPMIKSLANNLSKKGTIFCVNPPVSYLFTRALNPERFSRVSKLPEIESIEDNLLVYRPRNLIFNWSLTSKLGVGKIYWKTIGARVARILKRFLEKKEVSDCLILSWFNYPDQLSMAVSVRSDGLVYECYDEYNCKGNTIDRRAEALEANVLRKADVVFATSQPLYESRKKLHSNVFLTPNGVNTDLFNPRKNTLPPQELLGISGPILGYVGNITDFLDFDLWSYLLEKRPDWTFVFVGPLDRNCQKATVFMRKHRGRKNFVYAGSKEHAVIPAYIKFFDVALAPFAINSFTDSANPLTLWEYLAMGKPVVTSSLKAMDFLRNIVYFADIPEEFVQKIEIALRENTAAKIAERIAVAQKYSWDIITGDIIDILEKVFL